MRKITHHQAANLPLEPEAPALPPVTHARAAGAKPGSQIDGGSDTARGLASLTARVEILEQAERSRAGERDRKRRTRARQKKGLRQFPVLADELVLAETLVAGGFLDRLAADQYDKILEAFQRAVDAMVPRDNATAGIRPIWQR